MAVGTVIGVSLIGLGVVSAIGMRDREKEQIKQELTEVFEVNKIKTTLITGEQEKVYKPRILSIKKVFYGWIVQVEVPKGYAVQKFFEKVPVMEQATASVIKYKHIRGRKVELKLGCIPLRDNMPYDHSIINEDSLLAIPYYTPFGIQYLDFNDEATCHLIVAGATRMGKTVFLRLLFTHLVHTTGGNIQFFYINNKVEDYFPMQGVPQIPYPAETFDDAFVMLNKVKLEIVKRKMKLRMKSNCVNVKKYNEKYPDDYIPPLFVVFDEYGRFADDSDESKELQQMVQEIAETAGYLDVHLVISTQRPDATTVLKPRIRGNILTRVCFQTADEANSSIVIHSGDAAHLNEIRGRAVILDGMRHLAQIPYLSEEETMSILNPYRRKENAYQSARFIDSEHVEEVSSVVEGSDWSDSLPGSIPTSCNGESDYEKIEPKRGGSRRTKTKR